MLMEIIKNLTGFLAVLSLAYYLFAIFAARRFFSKKPPAPLDHYPPVSILIPLCGADSRAYENYAALCRQDYPCLQIVFGVRDPGDSSIALVDRLKKDFPETQMDLAVSRAEIGRNPKVNNLNNMLPFARHDVLVLMDSDIRIGPDFLKKVVAELVENSGGLLTCLYRAGEAPGLPSMLEAAGITAEFGPGVLIAEVTAGISFAFGAAIIMERRALQAAGGFPAIADYLADDYMIGNLVRKAGLPVRLSRCVVETVLSRLSFPAFILHQIRWARGIRACGRLGHTGSMIANGTILALLYLVLSGFSSAGWWLLAAVVVLRAATAWFVGVRSMGDVALKRRMPLVFARDLFSFFFWCAAMTGNTVEWRQKKFRIDRDGKMTEAESG